MVILLSCVVGLSSIWFVIEFWDFGWVYSSKIFVGWDIIFFLVWFLCIVVVLGYYCVWCGSLFIYYIIIMIS